MNDQSWFQVHTMDSEELNICLDHVQGYAAKTHIQNARQVNGSIVYAFGTAFVVNETLDQLKLAMKNAGPMPLDVPDVVAPPVKPTGATVNPNPVVPPAPPAPPKPPAKGTTTTSGNILGDVKKTTDSVGDELNKQPS